MSIRVTGDELPDRGVGDDRIDQRGECHNDGDNRDEESCLADFHRCKLLMGVVVYQSYAEFGRPAAFIDFAHIFLNFVPKWTES